MMKKWLRNTLVLILALLLLAAGAVVWVDPFFHYHAPIGGLAYTIDNAAYQTPGIAKNYTYDSAILGSSVTFDFAPSQFKDALGMNTVKLSMGDANMKMLAKTAGRVFAGKNQVQTIFYGLDHWSLARNPDILSTALPEYLWDDDPVNDVEYLFNKSVLANSVGDVLKNTLNGGHTTTQDEAYAEAASLYCGESVAMARFGEEKLQNMADPATFDASIALDNTRRNLEENLLPIIDAHPNTTFVVFLPPLSILYWYDWMLSKDFATALDMLDMAAEALLARPNVQLYSFLAEADIACNLYYYYDDIHAAPAVHTYMTDCFANGENRQTAGTWPAHRAALAEMVEGFDFGTLYGTAYPFKQEETADDWFACLKATGGLASGRYTLLMAIQPDESWPGPGTNANAAHADLPLETLPHGVLGDGTLTSNIENLPYTLQSGAGGASININGVEYAQRLPGYNLVVWDNETQKAADSIAFQPGEGATVQRRTTPR